MKNRLLKFMHNYLIYSLPVIVLVLVANSIWPGILGSNGHEGTFLSPVLAVVFSLWVLSFLWFIYRILTSEEYRIQCFNKLAGLQERDEREERIVGFAARSSFLAMLALLIVMFILSTIRMTFTGDKFQLGVGIVEFMEKSGSAESTDSQTHSGIPVTNSVAFAVLAGFQVLTFRYFRRKAENDGFI